MKQGTKPGNRPPAHCGSVSFSQVRCIGPDVTKPEVVSDEDFIKCNVVTIHESSRTWHIKLPPTFSQRDFWFIVESLGDPSSAAEWISTATMEDLERYQLLNRIAES